jgi:alpha-L-arabinofuranosidase
MATYAPLFAHVEGWQWRPDAIWYDNLRSFKSVSYYVQQLFAMNKGTHVLSLTMDKQPVAGQAGQDGLFASSVFDKETGEVVIKVVNTSKQPQQLTMNLSDIKGDRTARTITLQHLGSMDDENTLDEPEKIVPKESTLACQAAKKCLVVSDAVPAMTFRIYRIKK